MPTKIFLVKHYLHALISLTGYPLQEYPVYLTIVQDYNLHHAEDLAYLFFYIPFLIPFFIDIIYYFTAPVIPSANSFCKIKNTKAVGNVHIKTANISIP